jgi:hypothetical protein
VLTSPSTSLRVNTLVKRASGPVGIALVPSEAEAERAVATKLVLAPKLTPEVGHVHWVALPRNLDSLPKKTQSRVEHAFEVPVRAIHQPGPGLSRLLKERYLQ